MGGCWNRRGIVPLGAVVNKKQQTLLDPFSQKRVLEETRKSHFRNDNVHIEMAQEFGRRVSWAEKEGIPIAIAFESCREHFKIVGQAMIDIGESITLEMTGLKESPSGKE